MKKLNHLPLLLFFMSVIQLQAQDTLSPKRRAYYDAAKKMQLRADPDYFYRNGVNLDKYEELKAIGVDIKEIDQHGSMYNYKSGALMSTVAVVGTIVGKQYITDPQSFFHTAYKIKVEGKYKGNNVPDVITIYLKSGMINSNYMAVSTEPELFVGEKALFYLKNYPAERMLEAQKKGMLKNVKVDTNKTRSNSDFIVSSKYTIRSNYIFDESGQKVESLDKVIENIQLINTVNQSSSQH